MKNNKKPQIKKSFKVVDDEDHHLAGEILMIIGGFLIVKYVELIIPNYAGHEWMYFGLGFLSLLFGVKLMRKSKRKKI